MANVEFNTVITINSCSRRILPLDLHMMDKKSCPRDSLGQLFVTGILPGYMMLVEQA